MVEYHPYQWRYFIFTWSMGCFLMLKFHNFNGGNKLQVIYSINSLKSFSFISIMCAINMVQISSCFRYDKLTASSFMTWLVGIDVCDGFTMYYLNCCFLCTKTTHSRGIYLIFGRLADCLVESKMNWTKEENDWILNSGKICRSIILYNIEHHMIVSIYEWKE